MKIVPLPLGEGGAKRQVRVAGCEFTATVAGQRTFDSAEAIDADLPWKHLSRRTIVVPSVPAGSETLPPFVGSPTSPVDRLPEPLFVVRLRMRLESLSSGSAFLLSGALELVLDPAVQRCGVPSAR